jgi:hypothetical protein
MTLAMVVALLGLTILDGIFTLELLDMNSEEANPLMEHLLTRGQTAFLLGKYILTAAGLPVIVVYQHYPLFGTRFRTGWLLHVFIGLYLVLLSHQWTLFQAGRPESPPASGRKLAAPAGWKPFGYPVGRSESLPPRFQP